MSAGFRSCKVCGRDTYPPAVAKQLRPEGAVPYAGAGRCVSCAARKDREPPREQIDARRALNDGIRGLAERDESTPCTVDPPLWDTTSDSHLERKDVALAKAGCGDCPLIKPCREWALTFYAHEQFGVLGGMSAQQRKNTIRRNRPGGRDS